MGKPEMANKFCGLYVKKNEKEYLFLIGESELLADKLYDENLTFHVTAMKIFLRSYYIESYVKFNYILGFFIEKTHRKVNSCVNLFFSTQERFQRRCKIKWMSLFILVSKII